MGIKFHCPNGHKLNVKSFLAGRRGICPECGAKFEIPAAREQDVDDGEGTDVSEFVPSPAPVPSPASRPTPRAPQMAAGMAPKPVGMLPQPAGMMQPNAPFPAPGPMAPMHPYAPVTMVPSDPLLEAPQANWYVRPPSGGQYGPAQGDMVRRWIGEGRLTADSYVWREGWADWQLASHILAMHFAPANVQPMPQPGGFGQPMAPFGGAIEALQEPSPLARPHTPRRKSSNNTVAIVTVVLAVFLMFASLGFVYYWVNYLSDE